jgi:hypothetical protein
VSSGFAAKNQQRHARGLSRASTKTFFIIFVDAIFTTSFERPFTNVFDVKAQTAAPACVYPARTTG